MSGGALIMYYTPDCVLNLLLLKMLLLYSFITHLRFTINVFKCYKNVFNV